MAKPKNPAGGPSASSDPFKNPVWLSTEQGRLPGALEPAEAFQLGGGEPPGDNAPPEGPEPPPALVLAGDDIEPEAELVIVLSKSLDNRYRVVVIEREVGAEPEARTKGYGSKREALIAFTLEAPKMQRFLATGKHTRGRGIAI